MALVALMCCSLVHAGDQARAPSNGACGSPRLPHFDRTLLLESTSETSANVSIGELTGNGNLDLVLAKGRHWPLLSRILLNDGHGGFPVARDLGLTPYRSYSAVLADLTGEGILDVVVGNDAPDPKVVYLNDGEGHFRLGSTFGKPAWPTRNVAVADLNGDGLPDIVVANRYHTASRSAIWIRMAGPTSRLRDPALQTSSISAPACGGVRSKRPDSPRGVLGSLHLRPRTPNGRRPWCARA